MECIGTNQSTRPMRPTWVVPGRTASLALGRPAQSPKTPQSLVEEAEATTGFRKSSGYRIATWRAAPHAVAEHVGLLDAEVPNETGDVVGRLPVGERTVDVGGTCVSL